MAVITDMDLSPWLLLAADGEVGNPRPVDRVNCWHFTFVQIEEKLDILDKCESSSGKDQVSQNVLFAQR